MCSLLPIRTSLTNPVTYANYDLWPVFRLLDVCDYFGKLTWVVFKMGNAQTERLREALRLIDEVELQLLATVALMSSKGRDEVEMDDIAILLRSCIEKCRHDI